MFLCGILGLVLIYRLMGTESPAEVLKRVFRETERRGATGRERPRIMKRSIKLLSLGRRYNEQEPVLAKSKRVRNKRVNHVWKLPNAECPSNHHHRQQSPSPSILLHYDELSAFRRPSLYHAKSLRRLSVGVQ